jgi:hypothetical protein
VEVQDEKEITVREEVAANEKVDDNKELEEEVANAFFEQAKPEEEDAQKKKVREMEKIAVATHTKSEAGGT